MHDSTVLRIAVVILIHFLAVDRITADESSDDELVSILQDRLIHLRAAGEREWSSFPEQPQESTLKRQFQSTRNDKEWTLSLRQQDVKQSWDVRINDISVGRLVRHENDLITDFAVPPNTLHDGDNLLEVKQTGREIADDIRVGQLVLVSTAKSERRRAATIQVALIDENENPLPGRITITDADGSLVPVGAVSGHGLAVREGVVYTSTGTAEFGLAAGWYQIYGGRGFEFNAPSTTVEVTAGEQIKRTLQLVREVDTTGWVACDTHVHTVTHSGHGDATIEERMVTLAGEGIELPIATDHNKHIDYQSTAQSVGVRRYFTPVIGNEVTTKQGHFNIFPVAAGARLPDHTLTDWDQLRESLFETPKVRAVILNHARDIHANFRPFTPRHHMSVTGENLDERTLPANAMELINSGAVQTDPMQLFGDWCGQINRGVATTPVGSSDSHDVARYIVGQGRTYIRCEDADAGKIDVDAAVTAFTEGRVTVSYGLMATLKVNDRFEPGDVAVIRSSESVRVAVNIVGPSWADVHNVALYINGSPARRAVPVRDRTTEQPLDVQLEWTIQRDELKHDAWLCVVAQGPGVDAPFWQTAKPYQPDSPDFTPYTFASTAPVRIDLDGNEFSSARDYAERIVLASDGEPTRIIEALTGYDASVAIQTAAILQEQGIGIDSVDLRGAPERVRNAFRIYQQAWRESQRARVEGVE